MNNCFHIMGWVMFFSCNKITLQSKAMVLRLPHKCFLSMAGLHYHVLCEGSVLLPFASIESTVNNQWHQMP